MPELSVTLEQIRADLEQFIVDKVIDEKRVSYYSEFVESAHKQKLAWALSNKFEPIKSIQIYDAYKLIYDSLFDTKLALLEAKKRGENPTTAERLLPYFQSLVLFTKRLEAELEEGKSRANFNDIEDKVKTLRSEAIFSGILKEDKKIDSKIYKQLQETAISAIDLDSYL